MAQGKKTGRLVTALLYEFGIYDGDTVPDSITKTLAYGFAALGDAIEDLLHEVAKLWPFRWLLRLIRGGSFRKETRHNGKGKEDDKT